MNAINDWEWQRICVTRVVLVLVLMTAFAAAQSPAPHFENDLRVLLVGNDPSAPSAGMMDKQLARTLPLLRERTATWEALLRYHFANVTVVYGNDYRVEMSDQHDVTIFDTRPKALTPRVNKTDPKTGERIYKAASYLPPSYDHATITISDNSPRIGEPLGLKLDWL